MAINYTKIGWDTSKYVNPTNMNQMDDGIKAACDGVDALDTTVVKKAGDTMSGALTVKVDTTYPLIIKRPTSAAPNLLFANSNGNLGALAVVPGTGRLNYAPSGGTSEQLAYASEIPNAWRLLGGTAITATAEAHADLNTFTTAGTYYLSSANGANVDNKPTTSTNRFTLIVQRIGSIASRIRQAYLLDGTAYMYVRFTTNTGTSWSPWFNYAVNTDLDSYVKLDTLKSVVAASTDFANFKTRIAAL